MLVAYKIFRKKILRKKILRNTVTVYSKIIREIKRKVHMRSQIHNNLFKYLHILLLAGYAKVEYRHIV